MMPFVHPELAEMMLRGVDTWNGVAHFIEVILNATKFDHDRFQVSSLEEERLSIW